MAVITAPRRRTFMIAARPPRSRSDLARVAPAAALVTIVALAVAFGPLLVAYAPEAQSIAERLRAPTADHLLGTDAFGRDVLARLLAGVAVGAVAGYFGGSVDALLMRATELVMVFPTFFLIILIVATFGGSVALLILVIGLTSWPVSARIIRGEVLKTRHRDFVLAARAVGASSWRIIARHVLPNVATMRMMRKNVGNTITSSVARISAASAVPPK